ncbi:unnamed protein product [Rhizophagus irregularis]|nr:unnamed protein product [Rhizophagus irregularis]
MNRFIAPTSFNNFYTSTFTKFGLPTFPSFEYNEGDPNFKPNSNKFSDGGINDNFMSNEKEEKPDKTHFDNIVDIVNPSKGDKIRDDITLYQRLRVRKPKTQDTDASNLEIKEEKKEFICNEPNCKRVFPTSRGFNVHKRVHYIVCGEAGCGKKVTNKMGLQRHMRIHNNVKKVINVKKGIYNMERPRPYKCDWPGCGSRFEKRYTLKMHMRTHTGEKPYDCNWPNCGKKFSQLYNLKCHERTHTGEKPYQCNWEQCGKRFSQKHTLTVHMRIHTGEKPYDYLSFNS